MPGFLLHAGATVMCMHAGQGCALTTRLLVPREKYDEARVIEPGTEPVAFELTEEAFRSAGSTAWTTLRGRTVAMRLESRATTRTPTSPTSP